jgi:hypothetical protein
LRDASGLRNVPQRKTTVVLQRKDERRIQVWQLTASSALLLRLCDGTRTVKETVAEYALQDREIMAVSARQACLFGLMTLADAGFINVAPCPAGAKANGLTNEPAVPRYSPPPELFNTQRPWPWPTDWNDN